MSKAEGYGRVEGVEYSPSSSSALRRAEAIRSATHGTAVTSEMLLYGLLGKPNGAAFCFVGAFCEGDPRPMLAKSLAWEPLHEVAERDPTDMTANCRRILDTAERIASLQHGTQHWVVRDRYLFEAILDVPDSRAGRWLAEFFGTKLPLQVLRTVLHTWPPDEDFDIATVRARVEAAVVHSTQANGHVRPDEETRRVVLRHGDLLSDTSCDLLVLPCSAVGSISSWVARIGAEHHLQGPPRSLEFGTLGPIQDSARCRFAYAASVDDHDRSAPNAIETIGAALGRLKHVKRIGVPLLGAGLDEQNHERVPAPTAYAAISRGFISTATAAMQLVVLIPGEERYQQLCSGQVPAGRAASSTVISGFRSDGVGDVDLLDVEKEVEALCSVIAASDVEPPLSIGLFGDWGSGKSFFIDKMKGRLRDLSQAARDAEQRGEQPRYCSHITQLEFNAWRYIDSDLWASLAEGIIDGLARELEDSKDTTMEQRARLLAGAARSRDVLAEAERRRQNAQDKLASQEEVFAQLRDRAAAPEPTRRMIEREARYFAVSSSQELRGKLEEVAKELGTAVETTGAKAALLDLQGVFRILRAAWLSFRASTLRGQVVRLMIPLVVIAIAALTRHAFDSLAAWIVRVGASASATLTVAAPFLKRAYTAIGKIQALVEDHRSALEQERAAYQTELQERRKRIRTEVREAEARVQEAKRELIAVEDQLVALRADRMMADFIRKRHSSDDYRKHLGVIARARDDFEQLTTLLDRSRDEGPPGSQDALPRIDRIVLYIDDLDRCEEDQVVKVLQAVHLLLAFKLFVVVVAVDSRWLLHSLQQHSKAFRSDEAELAGLSEEERSHWQSTPLNYLEKIFQIPFSLNRMNDVGFGRMIDYLVSPLKVTTTTPAEQAPLDPAKPTGAAPPAPRSREVTVATPPAPVVAIVDAPRVEVVADARPSQPIDVRPEHLCIEESEQRFMKRLYSFVPSPRAAKRFVNVYRLLRAGVPENRLKAFKGNAVTGEYQTALFLLGLMIGFPTQATDVMRSLVEDQPSGDWWSWVDTLLSKKGSAPGLDAQGVQRWEEVAHALADLKRQLTQAVIPLPDCGAFLYWAPRVARFSFEAGRLGAVANATTVTPATQGTAPMPASQRTPEEHVAA